MAQLYHWPVPCTICESPVEYHCNTCGDVLCSKCRDNHLKSNATKYHDVVLYSQRTEPSKPSMQCGDHPNHQCGVWCQTCNRAVCSECVTSPRHGAHRFLKFDDKIGERRKEIQDQFQKYSTLLSNWQKSLPDAQKLQEAYEDDVKQLEKEIVDRADELCKQVRELERESRKQLQKIKDSSLRVLQDQQNTLADGIQRLKKKVKEIEDTLRSKDSSTILQYSVAEENIQGTKSITDDLPPVPVFTPGSLNIQVLKDMFGILSDKRVQNLTSMPVESKEVTPIYADPSVELVINIEYGGYTPVIACVRSDQVWVKTAYQRLQLLDRTGKVKRTINVDFYMPDMAATPQGKVLLPDPDNKCIRSMSVEGKIKTLFSTQWEPHGICCLPSGESVVAFKYDKKVIQYSSTGKIMKELDSSLFQYHPWYVAHSQVNQQLLVCDVTSESYILDASGRILAFDMNGKLQFTYTGSDTATFTPMAICTDLAGHVLITDYSNDRVHILDKGGNFIQYLPTGKQELTEPVAMEVDSDGYAWISEYNTGKLKVLGYCEWLYIRGPQFS